MNRLAALLVTLPLAACFDSDEILCEDTSSETGEDIEPPEFAEDLDHQPGPLDLPTVAGDLWHACDDGACSPGLECHSQAPGYEICIPIVGLWIPEPSDCAGTISPPLAGPDTFVQHMGAHCVPVCTAYAGPSYCDAEGAIECIKGECAWPQ